MVSKTVDVVVKLMVGVHDGGSPLVGHDGAYDGRGEMMMVMLVNVGQ